MLRFLLSAGLLLLLPCWSSAQADTLFITVESAQTVPDETLHLRLQSAVFDSLVSVQFSIAWDPEVLTYNDFMEVDLPAVALGTNEVDQGLLRFSWFSPDGLPLSLADDSYLISLSFTAIGQTGASTPVDITDNPLSRQVFRGRPTMGDFYEIPLLHETGMVTIGAAGEISVQFITQSVSCFGGNDGSIAIETNAEPGAYEFTWTNSSGDTLLPPLNDLPADDYFLDVRTADGELVFTGQTTVSQPATPLSLMLVDRQDPGCSDDDGSLQVAAGGGTSDYTYALNGASNSDGAFSGLPAGDYSITATDANGCTITLDATLQPAEPPQVDFGTLIRSFCGMSTITIGPVSSSDSLTYEWSDGSTSPQISVVAAGSYDLTVTAANECAVTTTYTVTDSEAVQAVLVTDDLSICPGDSLSLTVAGGETYHWLNGLEFLSADDQPTVTAFPDQSTDFTVSVSNSCGNSDTLTVGVEVFDILASAGRDTCVAPGVSLRLMASGGIFYTWEDRADFPVSNPGIGNPLVAPEATTTYRVLIEDINGCLTEDSVTVSIADDPLNAIPAINVITPNGDGQNDYLEFANLGKFGDNTLRVYNRSGRLVYNKVNYQSDEERFSGTFLEEPLPEGTYYYVLEMRDATIKQALAILR